MSAERVRSLASAVQHVEEEILELGVVGLAEVIRYRVLAHLVDITGLSSRRVPTPGTVLVIGRDRLVAVPAGLPGRVLRLVALVDDAGLLEDRLVVLGGGDVLVGLPHVGVDGPADAVLNLAPAVSLAAHPRDGRVPEVVGVDGTLDARSVSDALQLAVHRRGREGAVIVAGLVSLTGDLVEQGDVVLVRSGVDRAEVVPDRGGGVDQRVVLDVGALQPHRVRVGPERGSRAVEVDVADAERAGERAADARVGEELDERDVAHVVRALDERLDVLGVEHLVARGRVGVVDPDELVVVTPVVVVIAMDELEEQSDGRLDVLGCGVADAVVPAEAVLGGVPQVVDVLVELEFVQGRQRTVHPTGGESETLEVLRERGGSETAVLLGGELLDVATIVVVMPVEFLELAPELVLVAGEVVEGHVPLQTLPLQKPEVKEERGSDLLRLRDQPPSAGSKISLPTPTERDDVTPAETQGFAAPAGVSA